MSRLFYIKTLGSDYYTRVRSFVKTTLSKQVYSNILLSDITKNFISTIYMMVLIEQNRNSHYKHYF